MSDREQMLRRVVSDIRMYILGIIAWSFCTAMGVVVVYRRPNVADATLVTCNLVILSCLAYKLRKAHLWLRHLEEDIK